MVSTFICCKDSNRLEIISDNSASFEQNHEYSVTKPIFLFRSIHALYSLSVEIIR